MVRNEYEAVRKVRLEQSVGRKLYLPFDRLITADADYRRGTPLGNGDDENPKTLLRHSHISIVIVLVDKVQRRSDKLCHDDTYTATVEPRCEQQRS